MKPSMVTLDIGPANRVKIYFRKGLTRPTCFRRHQGQRNRFALDQHQ